MQHWRRALTQEDVDRCAMPANEMRVIRVLIDTSTREVLALSANETHEGAAKERLRDVLRGKRLDCTTASLASHLIGGVITNTIGTADYVGVIMESTLDDIACITHSEWQIETAERALTDYLYRSPIVRSSRTIIKLKAA